MSEARPAAAAAGAVGLRPLDPDGGYPLITSVTETPDHLYLGSLVAPALEHLAKARAGL